MLTLIRGESVEEFTDLFEGMEKPSIFSSLASAEYSIDTKISDSTSIILGPAVISPTLTKLAGDQNESLLRIDNLLMNMDNFL